MTTDPGQQRDLAREQPHVVNGEAGPTDIEATLLDQAGRALCSAYYVSIRKLEPAQ